MAKANQIAAQSARVWQALPMRKKIAIALGAAVPLALIAFLVLRQASPTYAVLYTNLSAEDAGELVGHLDREGVPYKLEAGSSVLLVPEDKVHDLRIKTAAAGLPRGGGVGFEIFDGQKFGTSSFVEQVNYRRALQGELSRSISAMAPVTSARVHIAMGKRSVFRDADEPPSASVALRLYPGRKLSDDQVRGVVNLVSSSVDGLDPAKVVVIDERGNVLSSDEETKRASAGGSRDLETALADKIRGLLEKVVGSGNTAVTVTAKIDGRQVDLTEEVFDQAKPALRSELRTLEGRAGELPLGGVAGAPGSLAAAEPPAPLPASGGDQKIHEERKYELSRTLRRTTEPGQKIARLHVAVLVNYARNEQGELIARPEDQLAQLGAIAREAAGIDTERGDRIEVRSIPFAEIDAGEPPPEVAATSNWPLPISPQLTAAAGGGVLLLLFGLVMWLRARKRRKNEPKLVLPAPVSQIEAALADGEDGNQLGTPAVHQRVLAAVAENPPHAARVIAAWLTQNAKAERKAA